MKRINHYMPPTPEDLARLKETLGYTSSQMAELAGLAQGGQWRKYTGTTAPRALGMHMHFYMAALLTLTDAQIEQVFLQMKKQGAVLSIADNLTP